MRSARQLMYHSEIDDANNLLKISYAGKVDAQEAGRAAKECETAVQKLRPGFRLLSDLSALEEMDLACVPHIRRMMDLCDKAGVELVVRVIPDPHKDIGLNILSLFHYRKRVRIVTCETLQEAKKLLTS
jgi:anti-anti-sigma regulatory factor